MVNATVMIELEKGLSLRKAVKDGIPMSEMIVLGVEPKRIKQALDLQIMRLSKLMNVKNNLNDMQVKQMVEDIMERYPHETLEDWLLVFKRGRSGGFGETYQQLDQAMIFKWMEIHLTDKAMEIESLAESAQVESKEIEAWTKEQVQEFYKKGTEFRQKQAEIERISKKATGFDLTKYRQVKEEYVNSKPNDQTQAGPQEPQRGGIDEVSPSNQQVKD